MEFTFNFKGKGIFFALGGILIITPDSLFIRLVEIKSWDLVFYRGIIPFFLLLIGLLIFYKKKFINYIYVIGYAGLINAVIVALTNITFIFSLENTNVANTLIYLSLSPFMAAFLSMIFLKEFPKKRTWVAMLICFVLVTFIFYDSYESDNFINFDIGISVYRKSLNESSNFIICFSRVYNVYSRYWVNT